MTNKADAAQAKLNDRIAKGREKLIHVAMKLFAEKGFDGVTVRDISASLTMPESPSEQSR